MEFGTFSWEGFKVLNDGVHPDNGSYEKLTSILRLAFANNYQHVKGKYGNHISKRSKNYGKNEIKNNLDESVQNFLQIFLPIFLLWCP